MQRCNAEVEVEQALHRFYATLGAAELSKKPLLISLNFSAAFTSFFSTIGTAHSNPIFRNRFDFARFVLSVNRFRHTHAREGPG
jgi:hypothetical protein